MPFVTMLIAKQFMFSDYFYYTFMMKSGKITPFSSAYKNVTLEVTKN
ncbi:hypothetical protein [Macrococcoides caseolyticum]|nr:hypothetical protein [Macrococcus caseolyticus]MCE4957984.1 hypothetical protein [Macrococcus caseolyticus]